MPAHSAYFGLLENSLENIHGLGELLNLRILMISCFPKLLLMTATKRSEMDEAMGALRSSLAKLGSSNLKYLSVVRYPEICADMLSSISPAPHHLETLDLLAWWFSRIPKWLAELHNLCSLDLCVRDDGGGCCYSWGTALTHAPSIADPRSP
jgi:hypothetical protein